MRDFQNDGFRPPLSPEGEARHLEILRLAKGEARGLRHRRAARRIAIACALAAVVGILLPHRHPPRIVQLPAPATRHIAPHPSTRPTRQPREIIITRIETDPMIAARLAIPPQQPTWLKIGDDALLQRLADAGKPAGLAYVDGRTIILFRAKPHP